MFTLPAWSVERWGVLLTPTGDHEHDGILNPGGVLAHDNTFHLFPRLVGRGNYSRIGHAVVQVDGAGRTRVQRVGLALEPARDGAMARYEERGVEDCRVVHRPDWGGYIMTYTAYGRDALPRVAWAASGDLERWERLGLVPFDAADLPLGAYANKDAFLLPEPVTAPDGTRCDALVHRPIVPGVAPSMWLSYRPLGQPGGLFGQHRLLAWPRYGWEGVSAARGTTGKIGGGAPALVTDDGLLLLYHGVSERGGRRCYSAGALLLDRERPHHVRARSVRPFLSPDTPEERVPNGCPTAVGNVVFPTAAHQHDGVVDIYYGAADSVIAGARLHPVAA
jgi:predicted GH43/DUF377 family glycosyl hydrolase